MSLKGIAKQTLEILEARQYTNSQGHTVGLGEALDAAVHHTRLYGPEDGAALFEQPGPVDAKAPCIEVSDETTQMAARRLVEAEGCDDLVLLSFASARNPGGGFINGAKAQEEDLARCSGLYPCLLTQPGYYEANRREASLLYTDHLIHSPRVPWFRVRNRELLDRPFLASVITAPAPNAGQVLALDAQAGPVIEACLRQRAALVLGVARAQGHRRLLLGAWGCGVFRNDPRQVADAFGCWLADARFLGAFDRVVFAIHDGSAEKSTLAAFRARFS